MTLREQLEQRNRQWRSFHEWEDAQPAAQRSANAILADLGTVLSWLPTEVRTFDPDSEKFGIGEMRSALALLHQG